MGEYLRDQAWQYAMTYGIEPNPDYVYFQGDDCTNFISQCLRAGGAKNDYHPTHPWWYVNGEMTISWSVAGSLYWYIMVGTKNKSGIQAETFYQSTTEPLRDEIWQAIEPSDLIQYRNDDGKIVHSSIITGFVETENGWEPTITQHSTNGIDVTWRKEYFTTAIFHHIIGINSAE